MSARCPYPPIEKAEAQLDLGAFSPEKAGVRTPIVRSNSRSAHVLTSRRYRRNRQDGLSAWRLCNNSRAWALTSSAIPHFSPRNRRSGVSVGKSDLSSDNLYSILSRAGSSCSINDWASSSPNQSPANDDFHDRYRHRHQSVRIRFDVYAWRRVQSQ